MWSGRERLSHRHKRELTRRVNNPYKETGDDLSTIARRR
jgi:hypothetical protein